VKEHHGYLFSLVSTAIFGGLIPWIVMSLQQLRRDLQTWRDKEESEVAREKRLYLLRGVFYILWFGYCGVQVDALYRFQAVLFGEGRDVATIVKKVVVDQFVYNPLWAAPTTALAFSWKDNDFSCSRLRSDLTPLSIFARRLATILMSTWLIWIPTVTVVYCLPSSLQVPLFNIALCFFVLILTLVAQSPTKDTQNNSNNKASVSPSSSTTTSNGDQELASVVDNSRMV